MNHYNNQSMVKRIAFIKMCADNEVISMYMVISMLEGIASGYSVRYDKVRDIYNNIQDFVYLEESWLKWHVELDLVKILDLGLDL